MKEIILKGGELISKEDFHKIIKEELKLPDYYGNNLDALWDSLTGDIKLPLSITWIDFKKSCDFMGDYALRIVKVFRNFQDYTQEEFTIKIIE